MNIHQKRMITQFLIVLGAAVIGACALAGLMIYRYSPTGHYTAGHAILGSRGGFANALQQKKFCK